MATNGGWIPDASAWPWIFLINLPMVVVALTAGAFLIPESKSAGTGRVDLLGQLP